MSFVKSAERRALRAAVTAMTDRYGWRYADAKARRGERMTELWEEAGKAGFLGVNLPAEYGGGGAGIYELSLVLEESTTAGCPLLMMVVSPAICGTVIARFGTAAQKARWLPGLADASTVMAFGITEPDAGSNAHNLSTIARRDGADWLLTGRKVFVSGVGGAAAVLVVARTEDARTRRLVPALFVVPTDTPGFAFTPVEMDVLEAERQYLVVLDDARLPAEALVGERAGELAQLFAGLDPERIMAAAIATGTGRYALRRAAEYAKDRVVWSVPIGAHQGIAHPLAQIHIELELARLALQKAATLYDLGDDEGAGECANMAKYAAAEASIAAVDQAVQTHGGNGLASEYGLAALLAWSRIGRVAPVSREMILNYVAQHSLGLPRSY